MRTSIIIEELELSFCTSLLKGKGYRPKSSLKVYFRYVIPFLWLKPWIKLFLGKTIHSYLELL